MSTQVTKKLLLRRAAFLTGGLFGVLLLLFLIIQIPWVQHKLLNRFFSQFNTASGFKLTYRDFYLSWYDQIEMKGLEIKDPAGLQMVKSENLTVNFRFFRLIRDNKIGLEEIILNDTEVGAVYTRLSDTTRALNFVRFISALGTYFSPADKQDSTATHLSIDKIKINNLLLAVSDPTTEPEIDKIDFDHFKFQLVEALFQNLSINNDTVSVNIKEFRGQELTNEWPVESIEGFARYSNHGIELLGGEVRAGRSILKDTLRLLFEKPENLSSLLTDVKLDLRFNSSVINPDDIRLFTRLSKLPAMPVRFSARISGSIAGLSVKQLFLETGTTRIEGDLKMDGLPDINETFISARLKPSELNIRDFEFAIPANVIPKVRTLGTMRVSADFTGFINDFVADGKFITPIGEIVTDLNLKIDDQNFEQSNYKGNLLLKNFDIGRLLGDTTTFQKVTLEGSVFGVGLSPESADFVLDGLIASAGVRHYEYKDIICKARFSNELFIGDISVNDPNLKLNLSGSVDMRDNNDAVFVIARIDTAVLDKINLTNKPLAIQADVAVNTTGLTADNIIGNAGFRNVRVDNGLNQLNIDSLLLYSDKTSKERILVLTGDFGSVDIHGNFLIDAVIKDVSNIFREFYLNARNIKTELTEYYSKKVLRDEEYRIDFLAHLNDLNPVIRFFNMDASISTQLEVSGHFIHGFTTIFHAFSSIPEFTYEGKTFYRNEIDFNGSKIQDSTSILAMLLLSSEKQKLSEKINTRDLIAEAIWNKDHVDIGIDFDQTGFDNSFRIKSEVDFLADSTRIRILPSKIKLLGKAWRVNPGNRILIKGKEVDVRLLELTNEDRSMLVQGRISEKPEEKFNVFFKDLTLDLLNSITNINMDGKLNGTISLENLYLNPSFENNFTITEFSIDDFLIGDVTGTNKWDMEQDAFVINFLIDRLQQRMIDVTGLYVPSDEAQPLKLTALLNQTQLKIFEPLIKDVFSNWSGSTSGRLDIGGTISRPTIDGRLTINDGQFTVNYLNIPYQFNGNIDFFRNMIELKNMEVRDPLSNKGIFSGYFAHRNFENLRMNLTGDFKNFQVLNTSAKQNDLFYGQAYSTGTVNFFGPLDNLKISASARTEKNTKIYIPVSGTSTVERGDFIRFISLKDSTTSDAEKKEVKKTASGNFSMSLNIEITPEAYSEIIFDIKAGDIIRGWGRGEIKLDLDTKGEFAMFGLYEFERGFYNFTLGGVINKEFTINKGSRISWYGDPYGATLGITATYRQLASLAPIMTQTSPDNQVPSQLRRKFPIEVALQLDGPMLSPQINFDILAKDLPENLPGDGATGPIPVKFQFNAFKARLDEQELKKQVFSLIVLRRFSPPDAFTTSGGIANSVSEFLSNQLSYWLSQVDQNLEVSLDLGSLDQDAFNISQLRMSYSLMNGRLRITRDGTLFSNQYNQSNVAALAGDWTVDYLLTADGKFKVKMYSRSNFNALLSSINTQTAYTTGLSLSHTQSFNRFSELLQAARRRQASGEMLQPEEDEQ
ncbi:MAG: translocation/assembly module TamB domain-containing protein [Cyclobacteriaceae bacterium]